MVNLQRLDLNLLRTLHVLLSENDVTRAAQRLNLSQPSVSVQLARLREIFADPLLLPGPRGMQPTARADELRGPLRDALLEITRKNLGMTAICDDEMNIIGIFTDGDLRRVFDTGIDMRNASIAEVMTRGGIRIRPGTLAVDALNLMQSRHITCVLVADGDRLVGVIHMHDLLRAGVV